MTEPKPAQVETRHTEERFAIRSTINNRTAQVDGRGGVSLVCSFFKGTIVTPTDVGLVYAGLPVDADKWEVIKKTLKERLTHD